MTPEELDVIRARVMLYADPDWRGQHSPKWVEVACDDAAALLAEVDRLSEADAMVRSLKAEMGRLSAVLPECPLCTEGEPLVGGWHIRTDPEGIDPSAKVPCPRAT